MPEIGGYTPASYISFSEDPQRVCHHHAEVVVDAPIDACYSLWADWPKLIDFLDLIGQVRAARCPAVVGTAGSTRMHRVRLNASRRPAASSRGLLQPSCSSARVVLSAQQ